MKEWVSVITEDSSGNLHKWQLFRIVRYERGRCILQKRNQIKSNKKKSNNKKINLPVIISPRRRNILCWSRRGRMVSTPCCCLMVSANSNGAVITAHYAAGLMVARKLCVGRRRRRRRRQRRARICRRRRIRRAIIIAQGACGCVPGGSYSALLGPRWGGVT